MSSFDEAVERRGTSSVKWDSLRERFGRDDLIPLWIADMDFMSPQPVVDAVVKRARHGIYGYTEPSEAYYNSVISWFRRRHGWDIRREWITFSPGILPAIGAAIQRLTSPGDGVIVQPPVYFPFFSLVELNGRRLVLNPLKLNGGRYEMDFDDLKEKARDPRNRMIILCSPHNPVGRVWTREELKRLGEIALENNIIILSDEIYADLVYPGLRHTPLASISEELAMNTIACTSPTKSFNLSGLQAANIVVPNERLRELLRIGLLALELTNPNAFATVATQAAYEKGERWLDSLIKYIMGNLELLRSFLKERMPGIRLIEPEGTYFVWLDFRGVEPDPKRLEERLLKDAGVVVNQGYTFGVGGEGFVRLNLACPRSTLELALNRIAKAFYQT